MLRVSGLSQLTGTLGLLLVICTTQSGLATSGESQGFLARFRASLGRYAGSIAGIVTPTDHVDVGTLLPTAGNSAADLGPDFVDADDPTIQAHWALLIAGSNGWGNYRHQADVCHAYQVLKSGGYRDAHIVIMMYDDISYNAMNPYPGKIFNKPGGTNVYEGVFPDYVGANVNSDTVLAVLAGNSRAVRGKGTGKVIASGPNDRVFVFYSDHGAPGILGMPSGDFMYADKLINTITAKRAANGFKEMVLYVEACESGSIFEGLLDPNLGVYAVTAANSVESSWGTYCPGEQGSVADGLGTCLGDLFSVAWMENAEEVDRNMETLLMQFFLVRTRTSNNFTYIMGSHAMQFGALQIQKERVGTYLGPGTPTSVDAAGNGAASLGEGRRHHAVRQRDADLEPLRHAYARAEHPAEKAKAKAALDLEITRRRTVDDSMHLAAAHLLRAPKSSKLLRTSLGLSAQQVFSKGTQQLSLQPMMDNALTPDPTVVATLVGRPLPGRQQGMPVVDSWTCLREMVHEWQSSCGPMDQYAMKHTRFFANLCNAGLAPSDLATALGRAGCKAEAVPVS